MKNLEKIMNQLQKRTSVSWQNKFLWLSKVDKDGVIYMFCSECKKAACGDKKMSSVWAYGGTQNIQFSAVKRHNESTEHEEVTKTVHAQSKSVIEVDDHDDCDDDSAFDFTLVNDNKILFNTIYHAAKCEMPTTNVNGLIDLQKKNGIDCKYSNFNWDTITEIQSCIARTLTDNIVSDVKASSVYAMMLDESTDIGVEKRLSICVRYVKNGEPCSTFLCSVHLDDGCAITIVNCVVNELLNWVFNLKIVSLWQLMERLL